MNTSCFRTEASETYRRWNCLVSDRWRWKSLKHYLITSKSQTKTFHPEAETVRAKRTTIKSCQPLFRREAGTRADDRNNHTASSEPARCSARCSSLLLFLPQHSVQPLNSSVPLTLDEDKNKFINKCQMFLTQTVCSKHPSFTHSVCLTRHKLFPSSDFRIFVNSWTIIGPLGFKQKLWEVWSQCV